MVPLKKEIPTKTEEETKTTLNIEDNKICKTTTKLVTPKEKGKETLKSQNQNKQAWHHPSPHTHVHPS